MAGTPSQRRAPRLLAGAALALSIVAGLVAAAGAQSSTADQLREIERTRLNALVEADTAAAGRLMARDFELINPAGAVSGRDDYLAAVEAGIIDYLAFEPTGQIVVRQSGDSAALRFPVHFDLVVGETRFTHEGWITELYERRDRGWQIVWEQATAIPNRFAPFLNSLKRRG